MMKEAKQAKRVELHKFLENQIEVCGKTQREIATELGYKNPNIITMFKKAHTKVPLDKIAQLATTLGVDPVNLLRIAMLEYYPDLWNVMEGIMGRIVSENEYDMIKIVRENCGETGSDPHISSEFQKRKLIDFAESLG